MSAPPTHVCRFRYIKKEGNWRRSGAFQEREIERISTCESCGTERIGRFRRILAVERESAGDVSNPDIYVRGLARKLETLFQTRDLIRAEPLIRRLGGARTEADIERLAEYGGIRLIYQPRSGALHMTAIRVIDRSWLADTGEPGAEQLRRVALDEARRELVGLEHPQAQAIADLIQSEAAQLLDYRTVRVLRALARLVEDAEIIPARLFSAKILGHSKALAGMRRRLERIVGSLERLGIRDSGQTVMMGGSGILRLPHGALDLSPFHYLGLSRTDALRIDSIEVPPGGVLIVENLTPFEACVDLIAEKRQLLVLWSSGFPGKGVLHVIRKAAESKAAVRIWCDVDLGGVRIARSILRVAPNAVPVLMDPETLRAAKSKCPLDPDQLTAIRRDLTLHPAIALADTLKAIQSANAWVEQETLIDNIGTID